MKTFLKILACTALVNSALFAQKSPIKFGKIEVEEILISEEERNSGAPAIVLSDFGETKFTYYDVGSIFQMTFERVTRIKIISKEGFKWADVSIPYYHDGSAKEQVLSLKGFTYNLNGSKVEKSKLTNSSIFTEAINSYWNAEKFSMPEVKEGSVIEYTYIVKSEFYSHLREWEFQWEIPVNWSEYIVTVPEYFNYQPLMQGYIPLTERTTNQEMVYLTTTSAQRTTTGLTTSTQMATDKIQYRDNTTRYLIKDAPALKEEPFITTTENYKSKIIHELNFIKFPNSNPINYMDSWEGLNKRYLENEDFGKQLGRTGFAKDLLGPISQMASDLEKLQAVHKLVTTKMKWNESSRRYSDGNLKKIFEEGIGSSADINLMLTGFLKEVGIEADPVILSTRSNGYIREQFAVSDQFNYVICRALIGDKSYLIDATEPFLPISVLPVRCMNGRGRIISQKFPSWIDLMKSPAAIQNITINLKLDQTGNAEAKVDREYKGYLAFNAAKSYMERGEENYITRLKENHQNWDISAVRVNAENPNEVVMENYSANITAVAASTGNLLYLNPILIEKTETNHFVTDDRKYPVEFGYPWSEEITSVIELPEGFVIDEIPKNISLALQNKAVTFDYQVITHDNKVEVTSQLKINQPVIQASDYSGLREIWSQIVSKHAEQIVLKKE
jgi:hypothetical protein